MGVGCFGSWTNYSQSVVDSKVLHAGGVLQPRDFKRELLDGDLVRFGAAGGVDNLLVEKAKKLLSFQQWKWRKFRYMMKGTTYTTFVQQWGPKMREMFESEVVDFFPTSNFFF